MNVNLVIFASLVFVGKFNNDEYSSYHHPGPTKYQTDSFTNNALTILECHTKDGNNDVYIRPIWMEYSASFCK